MDAKETINPGDGFPTSITGAEGLNSAAQAAFERHQPDAPSAIPGAGSAPGSPNQALPGSAVSVVASREMVRKALVGVLRTMDSAVQRRIASTCERLNTSEAFRNRLLDETALPSATAEEIAELVCVLCDKYGIDVRFAPELALALALGGYGAGVIFAVIRLSKMEAADRAKANN